METRFELKTELPFDGTVWKRMKKTATEVLKNASKGQYTQAIVLFSTLGKEYSAIINNALSKEKTDEALLLEGLNTSQDTEIRYVLCMWQDGGIDIPSHAFRNMLCALDSRNAESLLFVMTDRGISVVKLGVTMK